MRYYATVLLKWGKYKIPRKALNNTACCIVIAANGKISREFINGKTILTFRDENNNAIGSIMLRVSNPPLTKGAEAIEVRGWKNVDGQIEPILSKTIESLSPACSDTKQMFAQWLQTYHRPKMPVYVAEPYR